mgnify:CR=1 FL=1
MYQQSLSQLDEGPFIHQQQCQNTFHQLFLTDLQSIEDEGECYSISARVYLQKNKNFK